MFRLNSLKKFFLFGIRALKLVKGKPCNTQSFHFGSKNVLFVQFWVLSLKKFHAKLKILDFGIKNVIK